MVDISYDPSPAPESPEDLKRYLYDELQRIRDVLNELSQVNTDFYFEVARGAVRGYTPKNVVSHSDSIITTLRTVWPIASQYTYSSTADIDTISSSSAADTHDITIIGLDATWAEVTQTKTLTGTTAATLDTPLMRINTVINMTGSATAGSIYVWVSGGGSTAGVPTTTADIRGNISLVGTLSNEVSTSSVTSVPAGKTGMVVFGKSSITDGKAIELTFWARTDGGVFHLAHHVDFKDNNYDYFFKLPASLPEKTDLEVRATVDAGTAEVSANYDLILIDNA